MTETTKPKTIREYINGFPKETQRKLLELHKCLRGVAPEADEGLKWGVPALSYQRILFTFAAFKNHISLYPTPSALNAFAASSSVVGD
jgi:uncharacterized protein YdhG (YjbR/CyaY superfamily)